MGRKDQVDLVSSRVYPTLERSPGGPDNWVERAGGLPSYIERIAKHLHYEQGMTISRAIAVAVNTVKRWAAGGTVTSHGTTKRITPKTQALAAKAVAEWEAKKARGKIKLSREIMIEQIMDLAMTKDGRRSYKNQGKWRHGFIPVDSAAKKSKAKGSPIAARRIERLYGRGKALQASKGGATETAANGRAASARHALVQDSDKAPRASRHLRDVEQSRGGGRTAMARKPWADIPEADKVTRNGKRYVVSSFQGQKQLVEWTGDGGGRVEGTDPGQRVLRSLRLVDATRMSSAEIRRLLKVPGQPESVRKVLNKALSAKVKEEK